MTVVTAQYSVAPKPATVNLSSNSATSSVATATKPSTAVSSVVKKWRSTCEPMRLRVEGHAPQDRHVEEPEHARRNPDRHRWRECTDPVGAD